MIHIDSRFSPGCVAVPTGATARYNSFWANLEMLEVPKGTVFLQGAGPVIARNRNDMIEAMLALQSIRPAGEFPGNDYRPQWMFFLDDDHEFEPDLLMSMLERFDAYYNIGALGSLYCKKVPPFEPTIYKTIDTAPYERYSWEEIRFTMTNVNLAPASEMQVAGCGASGLLVPRSTLEAIGRDWFPEGEAAEDLGFCRKVANVGRSIYVQLSKPLGHVNPMAITPEYNNGEWLLALSWGKKGFRIPANRFHP